MRSKSGRSLWICLLAGLCTVLCSGCGYESVYARSAKTQLSVEVGQVLIAEPLATQAVASGARAELSTLGALGRFGSPRLVIDVLRVDETSRGIHVNYGQPRASGMSLAVTARGRVFEPGNSEPSIDTGDVRRAVQVASDDDPRTDRAVYDQALRSAAERTGRAVARLSMGIPEANDEVP